MIKLALIGKDIQHSSSAEIYSNLLKNELNYTLIDCDSISDIPGFQELYQQYDGVSITAPYKREIRSRLGKNVVDFSLTAVNCLYKKEGDFWGANTDLLAIKEILNDLNVQNTFEEILILGNGAMGTIVFNIASNFKLNVRCFHRQDGTLKNLLDGKYELPETKFLIINTCAREFVYNGPLNSNMFFWDLNYKMSDHFSLFNQHSISYLDGMSLLQKQAEYALKFWNLE